MEMKSYRDLTMIDFNENQTLVISCDSSGGVGNKVHDQIKTSPDILAYYITSVALAEILAYGAEPITIVNTLSVEMDRTGRLILAGIKEAISHLSSSSNIIITGSTEENFTVCQTGIGITVIGLLDKITWEPRRTKEGAVALVVGIPKVGNEVLLDNGKEILTIPILLELIKKSYIQEILPVGSKGILYEAEEMGSTNNLKFISNDRCPVDLQKSAGPATCAVVSIDEQHIDNLMEICPVPVNKIGKYVSI